MKKVVIFLAVIILIAIGVLLGYKYLEKSDVQGDIKTQISKAIEPKYTGPKVFNYSSKQRPVAVMLDNNTNAWPHANINNAYLIYEIEVEGGESRLMALFKDQKDIVKEVGPIRSARHYFLDYAMENDAIYAHLGQSPKAATDLKLFNMPDINGQNYDTLKAKNPKNEKEFWREKSKNRPHNAYTSMENLFNIAKSLNYKIESEVKPSFKYAKSEIELNKEDAKVATKITGQYHNGNRTVFEYNKEKKEYTKTSKKKLQVDETTKEPYTIKNLIILKAKITDLKDKERKGRKDVKTVATMEGYFATNGKAIKIKATKESRDGKTKYTDIDGNEIEVNDGKTYIMIIPDTENITIDSDAKDTETKKDTKVEAD